MRLISRLDRGPAPTGSETKTRGTSFPRHLPSLALMLTLLLTLGFLDFAAAAAPVRCQVPPALTRLAFPLPRTAARLAAGEELVIVAIGSSSTAGIGASTPAATYPARLEALLGDRVSGHAVRVVNKGGNGEDAGQMLARFDRDVLAQRPDLVIWQVGTNALLHDHNLQSYAQIIRSGVQRLREAGIDVIIMDPQYSSRLLALPRLPEILDQIDTVAQKARVPVFRRYAIMRHWVDAGQFDFADMFVQDRLHMNDASYDCIARLLAAAIVEKIGITRQAEALPGRP